MNYGIKLLVIGRTSMRPAQAEAEKPRGFGRTAQPSCPGRLIRVYKAAGRAQLAQFGCVFIFVQPQILKNDSFPSWSLGAKLVLFLASTLVWGF